MAYGPGGGLVVLSDAGVVRQAVGGQFSARKARRSAGSQRRCRPRRRNGGPRLRGANPARSSQAAGPRQPRAGHQSFELVHGAPTVDRRYGAARRSRHPQQIQRPPLRVRTMPRQLSQPVLGGRSGTGRSMAFI
jgi:hypothetical protein